MTFSGYEDYQIQWISSYFFNDQRSYGGGADLIERQPYERNPDKLMYKIPGPEPVWRQLTKWHGKNENPLLKFPEFSANVVMPDDGDALFYDKACTIPRMKCDGKWKRTLSMIKAKAIVVPEPHTLEHDTFSIFEDPENKVLWVLKYPSQLTFQPMKGHTLEYMFSYYQGTLSKKAKDPTTQALMRLAAPAACIHTGDVIKYFEKDQYIWNIMDGIYPKVVYESMLLKELGSEENKMDEDFIQSLIDLLGSKDRESVHQGMRVLAELDYAHYPSITKYILCITKDNWERFKPFNSACRFMFKELGWSRYGTIRPFEKVTPEEFAIAKNLFEAIIKREINEDLRRLSGQTNMVLRPTFEIDLSLPESSVAAPPSAESDYDDGYDDDDFEDDTPTVPPVEEEDCPDCPKADELDFSFINQ